MDQTKFTAPQESRTEQRALPQGPVELDPSLFQLVAGGAPKTGTWQLLGSAPKTGSW